MAVTVDSTSLRKTYPFSLCAGVLLRARLEGADELQVAGGAAALRAHAAPGRLVLPRHPVAAPAHDPGPIRARAHVDLVPAVWTLGGRGGLRVRGDAGCEKKVRSRQAT